MKTLIIALMILLTGCSQERTSENQAHRAWIGPCLDKTIRYQTSENENGIMFYSATCRREVNE